MDGVIARYQMVRHLEWSIDAQRFFAYGAMPDRFAAEAALDGLCVIRTSLAVERAFRSWDASIADDAAFRSGDVRWANGSTPWSPRATSRTTSGHVRQHLA